MKSLAALSCLALSLCASGVVAAEPAHCTGTPAENKAVVRAFYRDVFEHHDFQAATRYLAEDYRQHAAIGVGQGRAAFISAFTKAWEGATPEQRAAHQVTVLDLVADGDRVVILTRFVAGKKDGTRVTGTEFDMFEVCNGAILGHWSAEPMGPVEAPKPPAPRD